MSLSAPQDFGQPYILEDFFPVEQPTTSTSLCGVCHKYAPRLRCSGCKNIHYCSPACQSSDWNLHMGLCKSFRKPQDTRPSPKHRRALYFPSDQVRPRFIYLEYGTDGPPLDIQKCFPTTPREDIKTIAFHNRYLPYWIQISYDSNPSSQRTLAHNLSVLYAFRGPIVALSYDSEMGLSSPALDVDTTTLRPVVEYAKLRAEYEGPVFVEQPQEEYEEGDWREFMGKE